MPPLNAVQRVFNLWTLPDTERVEKERSAPFKFKCQRRSENARWNRSTLGMMMPGDTWFLTHTTSPKTIRPIKIDWKNSLRAWWRKYYPDVQYLWVETDEGLGVIHSLIRFPLDMIPPTEPVVQEMWQDRHQAFSTWSKVSHKGKMANYQRQKRKELAAGEMKKQSNVLSWDYSRGWLPSGFLKVWGAAWTDVIRLIPKVEQNRVIADWLQAIVINPLNLEIPPVFKNNLIQEFYVN
jgi:hypothetical protein